MQDMRKSLRCAVVVVCVFAVPSIAEEQKSADQEVAERSVGYMGVGFAVDPDTGKVLVEHVVPQAPAALAGVRAGDLLDAVSGVEVRFESHADVVDFFMRSTVVGVPVEMAYSRGSELLHVVVTPSRRPVGVAERNAKSVACRDGVLFAAKRRVAERLEAKQPR